MIDEALLFLRNRLNGYLKSFDGLAGESSEDRVVFVDGESMDPIRFPPGAVSLLLMNIEEERLLRPADRHSVVYGDGRRAVQPEIRLNLHVLFAARFRRYEHGLEQISRVIQHFQLHPVLDRARAPDLPERIGRLHVELVTMTMAGQNELWSALRSTYHPSVLYRIGLVAFRDERPLVSNPVEDVVQRVPE